MNTNSKFCSCRFSGIYLWFCFQCLFLFYNIHACRAYVIICM